MFLRDSLRRVVSVFVSEFNFWRRWGVVGVVDASVILVVDFSRSLMVGEVRRAAWVRSF